MAAADHVSGEEEIILVDEVADKGSSIPFVGVCSVSAASNAMYSRFCIVCSLASDLVFKSVRVPC